MDMENKVVEANLTEEQRKTIQDMHHAKFSKEIIDKFINSLLESSHHTSKSPMKQSTLDKWFVKSSKVPKTNEIPNSPMSSSTCTTLNSFESSNKPLLTDEELVKKMGLMQPKLSLHKIDYENHNTEEGSTAQKNLGIGSFEGTLLVVEKTGAKSFEFAEKNVIDPHCNMSHSSPNKAPNPKMRRSSRHLSAESTELNSTQSNATNKISQNKPLKKNCNLANKKVAKVSQRSRKSYASSDDSSIAEKLAIIDEDFDLRNQSTNNESLVLDILQFVPPKQQTCKSRQKSKTQCIENSLTTSQLNLTKQEAGMLNNEGNVLECEAPVQMSSCINENLSKLPKSDKQSSVTFSPIFHTIEVLSPNLVSPPGNAKKANKKHEKTGKIHKQSGTALQVSKTTEEGSKPDATGMVPKLFETNKEGNRKSEAIEDETCMPENTNKKSGPETTVDREEKSIVKTKSNKMKKLKTIEEPNKFKVSKTTEEGSKSDATGMVPDLFETNKEGNRKSEAFEDGTCMPENTNKKSGLEITVDREKKSISKNKLNKIKKSIKKMETNEEPNKLPETIDKGGKVPETSKHPNPLVTKKVCKKVKNPRQNSKLVTKQSPAADSTLEVIEFLVDLQANDQNKEYPKCVDSPSTKKIQNISTSEDDKLVSENLQCNAASVGSSHAESDEKQKNYEAFCTLQGACFSLGFDVEHLFQNRKLTKLLKSRCESDSISFIQGHTLKRNGQIVPSVYMHDSKKQLEDILKSQP